jgi:hypothetical protein
MKRGSKESLTPRLERAQYLEHFLNLGGVSLGGENLRIFLSKGVQTYGIPLADIEIGKRADELFCVLELACGCPEAHGTAAVQCELAPEVRFGLKFLEVIPVGSGEYSPVHSFGIFSRCVFPILRKFHT